MIRIFGAGGSEEVGRSALLLDIDGYPILLDYGIKLFGKDISDMPEYPLELPMKPKILLVSHGHLDHIGHVPHLFHNKKGIPWISTPPTLDIGEILWKDSMKLAKIKEMSLPFTNSAIEKAKDLWRPILYNQRISLGHFSVKFTDAGHIAGSAMITLRFGKKKIVYTGDFKGSETRMHKPAVHPGKADVWITEGTYYYTDHPPREEAERYLIESVEETLERGGNAIIAAFAVGRTQELLDILYDHFNGKYKIYLDGMGKKVSDIYFKYPGYVKNITKFHKAVNYSIYVEDVRTRRKALKEPSIIITTAGMLEGGPVLWYIQNANPESKVILTGYQVEGSNGRLLLESGKLNIDGNILSVDLEVDFIDFSAHAGKSELIEYAIKAQPEKILIVHSDNPNALAKELEKHGLDAEPVKRGEWIDVL